MKKRLNIVALLVAFSLLLSTFCFAYNETYVDCQLGTGDSDGSSEANAWQSLQEAADEAAAGDRINIEYDGAGWICTLTSTIDLDAIANLTFQGYSATPGDGTYAVIDGDSVAVNIFSGAASGNANQTLRHISMGGSTGDAIVTDGSSQDFWNVVECIITTAGDDGIQSCNGCSEHYYIGNEVTGTTGHGFSLAGAQENLLDNYIHDTTVYNIRVGAADIRIYGNILDTGTYNLYIDNQVRTTIYGNTLYNSTSNSNMYLHNSGSDDHVGINNIFDTAADYNINGVSGYTFKIYGYNNLSNSTTSATNNFATTMDLGGGQTETGMNTTTFQPPSALDDLGYPLAFQGLGAGPHREIGAIMYEETAGGAGTGSLSVSTNF